MRIRPAFVLLVGLAYAVLAEALARSVWSGFRAEFAATWIGLTAVVFLGSTAFISRRMPEPWVLDTATNAAAAAGFGAMATLTIAAYRVEWGAACNQCEPANFLVLGTMIAVVVAGLAAIPAGAVARRLFRSHSWHVPTR